MTTAAQAAPSPPSRTGRSRRWFPGERRVWIAAGAVLLVLAAVATVELLRPRVVYTGTNSISTRGVAVEVPDDRRFCVNGLAIPGGTGRVQLDFMGPAAQPRLQGELYVGGRLSTTSLPAGPAGQHGLVFDVPKVPGDGATAGRFCLTPRGGPVALGGMLDIQRDQVAPTLAGIEVPTRVSMWFRPPADERSTLLSLLPDIAHRAIEHNRGNAPRLRGDSHDLSPYRCIDMSTGVDCQHLARPQQRDSGVHSAIISDGSLHCASLPIEAQSSLKWFDIGGNALAAILRIADHCCRNTFPRL